MFFDRGHASTRSKKVSNTKIIPAPRRGWIKNENLASAPKEGAEMLRNWFPTPEGARLRGGTQTHATTVGAVEHLTGYSFGVNGYIFAATATEIYDVTDPLQALQPAAVVQAGLGSGDWSSTQYQAGGGSYLVMVNGIDEMRQYDGSTWNTINTLSTPAITGVETSLLTQVWQYKKRLFFTQKDSMSFWYLDVNAIAGTITEYPMGSLFSKGGNIMFGATWSVDSGSGLDDVCIVVTTEGEVAVFEGLDPSSTTDWQLSGIYQIGRPVHKNAWFKAGGDIAIVTDDGIVPISGAIQLDRSALRAKAITHPIETAWRNILALRKNAAIPFSCALWGSQSMLVVGIPTVDTAVEKLWYVANSNTGAWCEFTGLDARCIYIFQDRLFFGTNGGKVKEAEVTGSDDGENYYGICIPRFDALGVADQKAAIHARAVIRTTATYSLQLFANSDYYVTIPSPLPADESSVASGESIWGDGIWDTSVWAQEETGYQVTSEWQAVAAIGEALTVGLQITSGRSRKPTLELVSMHMQFETGQVF